LRVAATPEPFWLVEMTGQVVVFCGMAHAPGQNVYEYVVMICLVPSLAFPPLDELLPPRPSSGYSVTCARKCRHAKKPARLDELELDELEESATSMQHEL
jgi:hypothetical protein